MSRETRAVTDWLNAWRLTQPAGSQRDLTDHERVLTEAVRRLFPPNGSAVGVVEAENGPAIAAVFGSQLLLFEHDPTDDKPAARCRRISLDHQAPQISVVAQMRRDADDNLTVFRTRWTCEFGSQATITFTATTPGDPDGRDPFVTRLAEAVGWQLNGDDPVLVRPGS